MSWLLTILVYIVSLIVFLVGSAREFKAYSNLTQSTIGDWWDSRKGEIIVIFIPILNTIFALVYIWQVIWNKLKEIRI